MIVQVVLRDMPNQELDIDGDVALQKLYENLQSPGLQFISFAFVNETRVRIINKRDIIQIAVPNEGLRL